MTLVVESSPPILKNQELDDFLSFTGPVSSLNCSGIASGKPASCIKRQRLDSVNGTEHVEGYGNWKKKPRFLDGLKDGPAIPAVPLRSLPPDNDLGMSDTSQGEMSNNIERMFGQREVSRKSDLEKLEAIIAEANNFINFLDSKYSISKDFGPGEEENGVEMETNGKDGEEDVFVLSPLEWNVLPLPGKDWGAKSSIGNVENISERWKTSAKSSSSVDTKSDEEFETLDCILNQQDEMVPDCELTESECGEHKEHNFMDPEPKYFENHEELINLQIQQNDQAQRFKVLETLKLFEEQYAKLLKERKPDLRGGTIPKQTYAHFEAAGHIKRMGRSISVVKPFGHVPGVVIGDEFRFRAVLGIIGLHRPSVHGIDYVDVKGKKCATSVVDSGRYENRTKGPGVLIYNGHGGNLLLNENVADQKLERGNLALVNSMEMGFPIRVIYKRKNLMATSNERDFVYVYDGLYIVNDYWRERGEQAGKIVYKFELHRIPGQPKPHETNARSVKPIRREGICMQNDVSQGKEKSPIRAHQTNARSVKPIRRERDCVQNDVSQGKEKFPIRAVNQVDDDLAPHFTYITEIVYPNWFKRVEPIGCDCTDNCFDSEACPCLMKNGHEIPFNKKGAIVRAKPRVYECGPSCKCSLKCINRVTQHGLRHKLEIFKTKLRGWGLRSRGSISSGSFVCEYIGELLRDKEAEQRINNDEYLFDICDDDHDGVGTVEGFTLDAKVYGNVGRFINHSCSPNLYAQEVLYDHDDQRFPHIMFFAQKDIPRYQELTYDYNYKMGRVCDANGNTRTKDCYCGARKCTGKMY